MRTARFLAPSETRAAVLKTQALASCCLKTARGSSPTLVEVNVMFEFFNFARKRRLNFDQLQTLQMVLLVPLRPQLTKQARLFSYA